ncbi:hypothetical protein GGF50DRAFT_120789 [Schizophyllum commune]
MHQITSFRLEDMAQAYAKQAPGLWKFLAVLLWGKRAVFDAAGEVVMSGQGTGPASDEAKLRREQSVTTKRLVCMSILMQSVNQKCNAFQATVGIYLKSCNTPERVVDCLQRMGISISQDSIYSAINSLSLEAIEQLRHMGQSLLIGYIFDNLDIDFSHATSTVENAGDTLAHLTAGTAVYLDHGAHPDVFRCSELLYQHSRFNINLPPSQLPKPSFYTISRLHPELPLHPSGLNRRQRFNAWIFLCTLVEHGPEYFRQFQGKFAPPEAIDEIPVVKLRSAPFRMMDISQSSVGGNIDVIAQLLQQAGVGDPRDAKGPGDIIDITRHVLLFHGDLGTYERVMSILEHRSIEATPFRRFQFVVFIFGLFHMKMAAADALWRIFVRDKAAHKDPTSLMRFVTLMRPNDSGKIASGPRFRQMHEVITRTGTAFRLDAWREAAAARNPAWKTLEDFASSKPTLHLIEEMAGALAKSHVSSGTETYDARHRPAQERDAAFENTTLLHRYFLLYEELSYAMNVGDIGRVEVAYAPWAALFKATGKHKYATAMIESLSLLYASHFPADLRRIIRYNSLVNPTGVKGKFRALDWVQEDMNLKTKVIHGGTGSNYTKEHVIKESVLLHLYRDCHENMNRNFHLTSLTTAHAPANLTASIRLACDSMTRCEPNKFKPGRSSEYTIVDMLDKGTLMLAAGADAMQTDEEDDDGDDLSVD